MVQHRKYRLVITCGRGIPPYLSVEVARLGLPVVGEGPSFVASEGTLGEAMLLNLHLRTGQRVHLLLHEFRAHDPQAVYRHVSAMHWEQYLHEDGYFSVFSSVDHPTIRDSRFVNLKVKDAVADRMRTACGRRPDSGPERGGAVVYVHWTETSCAVYLDTSGESLSKRGYRKHQGEAPMQEALAAALLMAAGWEGGGNLVNPMCGSGTLAIEAALMSANIAPGLLRDDFAFMHLKGYSRAAWDSLKAAARQAEGKGPLGKIMASDILPGAVDAARRNARDAGVAGRIEWSVCDFAGTPVPDGGGIVIMNPEYGQRMGSADELGGTYAAIGDFLKKRCRGYRGYVFTGNLGLARKVGLRSKRRLTFYNGPIECRLLEYELYEGSRKNKV